jgi:hypothetical protein
MTIILCNKGLDAIGLKEYEMAKRIIFGGMLCLILAFAFTAAGCKTTDVKSGMVGEYNLIPKISSKDFDVLGFVTVETHETIVKSPLYLTAIHTGEIITYDLLLREALRLYPDVSDIINIRIDRNDQGKTTPFDWLLGTTKTIRYIGNALAIKYTVALEETREPLPGRNRALPRYMELY